MKLDVTIKYLNCGIFSDSILINSKITEEDFLLELVNKSNFRKIKGGKKFRLIELQSNKENDITNNVYSCDFKLVVSSDFVKAETDLRNIVNVLDDGVILTSGSRKRGQRKVINLAKAIRTTSLEEMIRISKTSRSELKDSVDKSMKNYIENLKKDKNLFLFIPAEFSHRSEQMNEEEKEEEVLSLIYEGFQNSKLFRDQQPIENKDLFLSFIYRDQFVIIQLFEDGYYFIDKVDCEKIQLFSRKLEMLEWC